MRTNPPGPVLVAALALLLLVLSACSSGGTEGESAPEPTATTSGSELFAAPAVCPREEAGDAGCPLDQSGEALDVSGVVCSTAYSGESDTVSIRFDYDGQEVFTRELTGVQEERGSGDEVPLTGFLATGSLTLPGGQYACSFDDGAEEVSLDFESSGEPGPVTYTWACDEADTQTQDNATFCVDDTDSLGSVDAFTCSTVLTGVLGEPVDVRLSVTDSAIDSEGTLELTGKAPLGILVAHATLDGEQLAGRAGAKVPAGSYRCEWVVGGEQVAVKDVEVTG